jgi:hypothetical protein
MIEKGAKAMELRNRDAFMNNLQNCNLNFIWSFVEGGKREREGERRGRDGGRGREQWLQ